MSSPVSNDTVTVDTKNVLLANVAREDGQGNAAAEGIYLVDASSGLSPNVTQDGTAGTKALCVHRTDGTALAGDGTDGTGITPPTGATGIRGWLSGIYKLLQGTLGVSLSAALPAGANNIGSVDVANTVDVDVTGGSVGITGTPTVALPGVLYYRVTDNTLHTFSATRYVGLKNLSSVAQAPTATVYDGTTTSGTPIEGPLALGAGETVTNPLGGLNLTSGNIAIELSATPGGNGVLLMYLP